MSKVYNFNAGPAILPKPVLEQVQGELLDYHGTGMSIVEMSHRSAEYEEINARAQARLKQLLGLGDDYKVLFVQGGASTQFAMLPMNFLPEGATADYVLTGSWSEKALAEAKKLGNVHAAASTKDESFSRIPDQGELRFSESPAYVHITSNNTIYGTQWQYWPEVGERALVADMSSDILSREFDATKFSLIYAGAQKNLGPAGVTVVVVREDLLSTANPNLTTMLSYVTHAEKDSLFNTPPVFAVYVLDLVLGWIEASGGVRQIERCNQEKASIVYEAIDSSDGYYRGHAVAGSRSLMNVTFRLPDTDQEKRFLSEAKSEGFVGLAGHRSVGGVRVSLYNAMNTEGCRALAEFMQDFARRRG